MTGIAFDTTALGHFARAERLDELRVAAGDDEPVLLAEVAAELERGVPAYPALGRVAVSGWLKFVELEELRQKAQWIALSARACASLSLMVRTSSSGRWLQGSFREMRRQL